MHPISHKTKLSSPQTYETGVYSTPNQRLGRRSTSIAVSGTKLVAGNGAASKVLVRRTSSLMERVMLRGSLAGRVETTRRALCVLDVIKNNSPTNHAEQR